VRLPWDAATTAQVAMAAATLILAIATAVLAFFTSRTARSTRRTVADSGRLVAAAQEQVRAVQAQVAAAQQQTELTQQRLAATTRPIFIDVPFEESPESRPEALRVPAWGNRVLSIPDRSAVVILRAEPNGVVFSVPLRNGGSGAAIIRGSQLYLKGQARGEPQLSAVVVPAGERVRVSFTADMGQLAGLYSVPVSGEVLVDFQVAVVYTDVLGGETWRTTLWVKPSAGAVLRVSRIALAPEGGAPYLVAEYPVAE